MDRLENMRVFAVVAETRSFARTAKRLALSAPAVTRAVHALEQHVGTQLLHRTTRAVRLTDVGARFLADVRRILSELDEAEATARGSSTAAVGELAVTAPLMFGRLHVAPVLLSFLRKEPQLTSRTLFADQLVDLFEERIDVAVRIGSLEDSSLKAVKLGSLRRVLCAAPSYLEQHGVPRSPDDLASHRLIAFVGVTSHRHWAFRQGERLKSVAPNPRMVVNAADMAIAAACAGHGLTRVLSYQVEQEVRAGALRIVMPEFEPLPTPVHLVRAENPKPPARVRLFMDFAVPRLRSALSGIQAAFA
ncbi:MAG: LysR family transcriptional regulator [Myxococcales bacterium]